MPHLGKMCECESRKRGEVRRVVPHMTKPAIKPPASIDQTLALLAGADYLADRSLATVLFLALRMGRPLFLEGEAGVGKTEIAKVLASTIRRRLIRQQCNEGLDVESQSYENPDRTFGSGNEPPAQ